MALRESRHSFRRVGVYMVSITLGVGALVAIHSFRDDVSRSVQEEADVLMGANARLASGRVYPDSVARLLDSLRAEGVETSRVTTASSMVLAPSSNTVRLLQVRAVEGGYPFYGTVTTRPEGRWTGSLSPDEILVDPAVLTQLDVVVGDTLVVGRARLAISATVEDLPTSLGFQTAIGPRVYISQEALTRAELLGFGSLAEYETYLRMPDREARETFRTRYEEVLEATKVRFFLAEEQAQSLSNGIRFLGRFLALVGLAALLLGGIGVASAIHVFARDKRTEVAVLRCIGVGQWTAFIAYLIQASALGLLGAFGGVVVGVAVQQVLPFVLGDVLPVDVTTRFSFTSAAAGLGIGVWVAFIFAIIPLLQIRNVPPLQAIRQDFEPERNRLDPFTLAAYGFLAASVVALCVLEAPEPALGLGFAGALTVVVGLLTGVGWVMMRATRRFFPRRASYPVRQGVSNLFRPQNQTIAVTLALGFGAFVIGTVVEVEGNLRKDLTLSFGGGQPNLLFFDIQKDQIEGVVNLLPEDARAGADVAPLVSARIVGINGQTNDGLRADSVREDRPDAWALRRQYRNTYRERLGRAEELISGRWWDGTPGSEDGTRVDAGDFTRVSLESDVAEGLKVGLGDTIQWEVSGVPISTVVTSIRTVDWGRMEPNFYAIFEPGGLEDAPQTAIMVARLPNPEVRASVQRDLVTAFPNVSALDFSRVQEAIDSVLSKVRQAVAFLGFFSAIAGMVVLVGALASSRAQRLREGALLKTLGASKRQVLTVLFSEYLALGTLATTSGLLLAAVSAAILMPLVFEIDYSPRFVALSGIWLAVTGLTVVVGLLGSRNLLGRPPLAVLRDAPE
jgi:putative ABC transport system permease protein